MKLKVAILGAGAMGSAISIPLIDSRNYVNLWGTEYDVQILNSIVQNRFHPSLKTVIPEEVNVFYPQDLDKALEECDTVFIAVSSEAVNSIIKRALPYMKTVTKLVILSKGLYEDGDNVSLLSTMIEEIVRQTRKEVEEMRIVSVGGPCIAEELANKVPTAVLYASKYLGDADECKKNFETAYYRIHTTSDVIGCDNVLFVVHVWIAINMRDLFA